MLHHISVLAYNGSMKPLFDTLTQFQENGSPLPRHVSLPSLKHATSDYQHTRNFLYSYRGSEATFNAYRRELERFLHWCWTIKKSTLPQITRSDIEKFVEFCQGPPKEWISKKNAHRFIEKAGERLPNPDWRPFTAEQPNKYFLSQKALQAIFAVLSSFYNYLIQENYAALNPVAQIRQKSKFLRKQPTNARQIRRLSELQWAYVIETAEQMAEADPEHHERTLFMMNALFGMYLRISELAASQGWQPQMGHFARDSDGNWWFRTVGKGNKERIISVSDSMLNALKRYRQALDLTPLPSPGDSTPLLMKNKGTGPITSTRQIRAIVQSCFDKAIIRLHTDGFHEEADQLKAATVHWLRHTGISEDVKHRPREHVRDDAGHGSSAITDKYIDIELRARHASAKKKRIKPPS